MDRKKDIKSFDPFQLESDLTLSGFEAYRAKQIIHWVWKKRISHFDEMKNIPLSLKKYCNMKQRKTQCTQLKT